MLVAGGTDLYPNMKRRQFEPKILVGLRHIADLAGVRGGARAGLAIGAVTTLASVATHPEVARHYPALAAGPSKPLDNTDFTHPYRKKMTRVFVARALRRIAGLAASARVDEEIN